MSRQTHILLTLLSTALIVVLTLTGFALYHSTPGPNIQGKVILPARTLPAFHLTDHRGEPFTPPELEGRWHLVSYGFTHCPDICPSTLAGLGTVINQLDQQQRYNDVDILFYSVDPQRDTPDHLAEYVSFFNSRLTGLTQNGATGETAEPFERALGIAYSLPETDRFGEPYPDNEYPVVHGVDIYLINPEGKLQAIFEADYNEHGMVHFSVERVLQDYIAVREYLGGA